MVSRTSAITLGLLLLGTGIVLFADHATKSAEAQVQQDRPQVGPGADVRNSVDPVFGDWFALGSKCRARASEPGDVRVEFVPVSTDQPLLHRARFHMPDFHLSVTGSDEKPGTASECSLRLAINPGPGHRIRDVRARTRVVGQRSADSEMRLTEELKLGSFRIGSLRSSFSAGTPNDEIASDVILGTDAPGGAKHPEMTCGENKLVAFDFTWLARRGASERAIQVDLGGDKTVDIDVVLETCVDAGAEK